MSAGERPRMTARSLLAFALKLALTVAAFALLLTHPIETAPGERVIALDAIRDYLPTIDRGQFWRFTMAAFAIKLCGIAASMLRWSLLLSGQGILFPAWHLITTFFIGRFLGTFLPSTIGLDGYKLYDAARFSGRTVEVAAATVTEKIIGFTGIFLTFLVTLPFGYTLLGERARTIALLTVPVASVLVSLLLLLAMNPMLLGGVITWLPQVRRLGAQAWLQRLQTAAVAYRRRKPLLLGAAGLSFLVHFCTAASFYFTAIAIGAQHARFWEIALASTIQILATVLTPLTIAGEGVREIVQALLLAHRIGASESILSAALGFWAAEAPTLVGGVFYILRRPDYHPSVRLSDCPS